jgi:hypothetical protein
MEGFTSPQSNIRTASLPNPCPIGLLCRALCHSGCARPQLCSRPTHGGIPIRKLRRPHHAGIPAPWLCRWTHDHRDPLRQSVPDPSLELVPQLSGIPTPPIRPCLAPALCGTTGAPPCWDRHHPGVRQLHPPDCQESHFLCGVGPSSTGFPDNRSTRFLLPYP